MPWQPRRLSLSGALRTMNRRLSVGNRVRLGKDVHIGLGTKIWASTQLTIEGDVYIGRFCTIECDGRIGSGTLIANLVGIVGRDDHDLSAVGVSARRAPWIGDDVFERRGKRVEVEIGTDVWIGYGATILSGVTIGRGAIVAAGAVVTRNAAPYSIVAGNPAREVGRRFSDDQIAAHERVLYGVRESAANDSAMSSNGRQS